MDIDRDDERWKPIDEAILRGEIITALIAIRNVAGVGLREANSIFQRRYRMLCESRPSEFTRDHQEYWNIDHTPQE
jgi:hypothetical protein